MQNKNNIAAMNPEKYLEKDGTFFDIESFHRHCAIAEQSSSSTSSFSPAHTEWYDAAENRPPIPCMPETNDSTIYYGSGSSYRSSHASSGSSSGFSGYGLELI